MGLVWGFYIPVTSNIRYLFSLKIESSPWDHVLFTFKTAVVLIWNNCLWGTPRWQTVSVPEYYTIGVVPDR